MSEPLEFREEANALAVYINREIVWTDQILSPVIESALREAAAKALEWSRTAGFSAVLEAISALRTPSAPNAPR